MINNVKIEFWGIGAQKSGTSWLFYNLNKVPLISIPPNKGLHYFDRSSNYPTPNTLSEASFIKRILKQPYRKEIIKKFYLLIKNYKVEDLKFYYKWYFSNYNDDWYLSIFKDFVGVKGEITPSYSILNVHDIKRMYALSPNAKIILMLRNPIDRAWSHYRHTQKKNIYFSFQDVKNDSIIEFIESEGQILRSDYVRTIENFSHVFPKSQILICFFDAIVDNPNGLLNDIINFLTGVEKSTYSFKNNDLKRTINKSIELDCPNQIYEYLKIKYRNQIKVLSDIYGGYFNKWQEDLYGVSSLNDNTLLLPTIQHY